MLLEAIYHRPKLNFAYAYNETTVHIRVRTKESDMELVQLIHGDKYDWENTMQNTPMSKLATDALYDYYQVEIVPPYRRLRYAFHFRSAGSEVWFTEKGFHSSLPKQPFAFFDFPFINPVDVLKPPQWVKDAIFYQIFPERFANGDSANDPKDVQPWGGKPTYNNFFGGDLQGVIDNLDYLEELGINALYFTPLFEATTNHKYDTIDYLKVDPHFGDNQLLKRLVELCHQRGMKVLLDAVFNHSGFYFPPFQDVLKNGEKSKYVDWFHIRDFPIEIEPRPNYDTFAFTHMMPKLNTENEEVKDYLLKVAKYWIEEIGVDGWRLDVANEVDHQFWREFRNVVKSMNNDAYILGEIWHDSMPWLQGDQFDAVMNYPVTDSILNFMCKAEIDAQQFANEINHVNANYPLQVNEVAFNLLDSHDTPRLITICKDNKEKLKLAVTFQFTYLGTPCIYYGDEIGLTGEHDPDCRKTFIWDKSKQDQELLGFYQTMIKLRKENSALRAGSFRFIYAANEQIVYERKDDSAHFIIAMNASNQNSVISFSFPPGKYIDIFSSKIYYPENKKFKLTLAPYTYLLLKNEVN